MKLKISLIGLLLLIGQSVFAQKKDIVIEIQRCTQMSVERQRLACFDDLFQTPIHQKSPQQPTSQVGKTDYSDANYPLEWRQAWDLEKRRKDQDGFLYAEDNSGIYKKIWFTQIINNGAGNHLLVLSCIDKISRVELMMLSPFESGSVKVGVSNRGGMQTSMWLSDDTGFIIRAGRGLPSIAIMKSMLGESRVSLEVQDIGTFEVDTTELSEKIKPLRTICTW